MTLENCILLAFMAFRYTYNVFLSAYWQWLIVFMFVLGLMLLLAVFRGSRARR